MHGAAATFVGQGARFALQFASQIVLARLLLPAEFGLVAMIAPVMGLISIFTDLGLSQATVQRGRITAGQLSALFWTNLGASVVLALLLCAAAPAMARFYGEPQLMPVTVALSMVLVLSGLAAQQVALLNRDMRFVRLAVMDVGSTAAAVGTGIAAAWCGLGVWSLVLMQAANMVTILLIAWSGTAWRPGLPRREPGIAELLRFGSNLTGYNLISFLGANLDNVLIGKVGGSMALGLYDRAFKLVAAPLWTISLPVDRIAVALLSRLQSSPDRYRHAFLRMVQVLLLVTVPAVALVAGSAPTLVPTLLGPAWAPAAPIVRWLAVATGFAPLSIAAYWLFVSQDRTGEQAMFACARTAGSVATLLAGLPWGPQGVAVAYATTALAVNSLPLWGAAGVGPVSRRDAWAACWPMLLAGGASSAAVVGLGSRLTGPALPCLAAQAVAAYAAAALALACLPGGRALLADLWRLHPTLLNRAPAGQGGLPPQPSTAASRP